MPEGMMEVFSGRTRLISVESGRCVRGTSRNLGGSLVACNRNSDLEEALSSTLAGYECSFYSRGRGTFWGVTPKEFLVKLIYP